MSDMEPTVTYPWMKMRQIVRQKLTGSVTRSRILPASTAWGARLYGNPLTPSVLFRKRSRMVNVIPRAVFISVASPGGAALTDCVRTIIRLPRQQA
jgi:hypothetical protein